MRTRSTILGFATLIVLLTAGAAQSLSGSNTLFTDDIVDGTVTTADIKNDAITGPKIKTGGIFGSDIADNAVTGADIDEARIPGFKKVYFARVMFVFPTGTEASHEVRLYGGDAQSVELLEPNYEYIVTFPFNVTACAPSVTAGSVPGLVSPESTLNNTDPPVAYTTIKTAEPQKVSVKFKKNGSALGADSFSLTLVCP